jgi:hypothetical protein
LVSSKINFVVYFLHMIMKKNACLKTFVFFCWSIIALVSLSAGGCTNSKSSSIPATSSAPLISPSTSSAVISSTIADNIAPVINTAVPADRAADIPVNCQISATFSEKMDPASITTAVFTLKEGTESLAGTVTYSGTTAVFTPLTALMPGKTYSAGISQGAKDLAGNILDKNFSWSFTTSQPRVEPSKTPADTTPPSVSSVSPKNGAEGIDTKSTIEVAFSEDMDASTINTSSMVLGTAIKGTLQYNSKKAVFTPAAPLEYETSYTFRITTQVKDAAGNAMQAEYSWSFKTLPKPDTTAPAVISVNPTDLSTDLAVGTSVTATFSEVLDGGTVSSETFLLHKGSTSIAGTVSYKDTTAVFVPSEQLSRETTYVATLTTGLKDKAGNALQGNYQWSFTTLAKSTSGGGGTSQTRTIVFNDDSLPEPPAGMTAHFTAPSGQNTEGGGQIRVTSGAMAQSIWVGVTDGKLWVGNIPPRDVIASLYPSLLPLYDSLGLTDFATYNEKDYRYWFFDLPPWLDIEQYDPDVTKLPYFVSINSKAGTLTAKYRLQK